MPNFDSQITGNYGEDQFRGQQYQLEYDNHILCSDMTWKPKDKYEGTFFSSAEIEYLLDRWNQKGTIDINKIKII